MALAQPPTTDRLRGAFLRLVRAVWPQLLYFATYEAKVVASSPPAATQSQLGGLTWVVSVVFTDAAVAAILPPLAGITMWPGPVWGYSQPAVGSLVRVQFVNGDPSKPAIVGLDPSTLPTAINVGPLAGAKFAARITDPVSVTFTTADAALILDSNSKPCSAPNPIVLTGTITGGSVLVKAA